MVSAATAKRRTSVGSNGGKVTRRRSEPGGPKAKAASTASSRSRKSHSISVRSQAAIQGWERRRTNETTAKRREAAKLGWERRHAILAVAKAEVNSGAASSASDADASSVDESPAANEPVAKKGKGVAARKIYTTEARRQAAIRGWERRNSGKPENEDMIGGHRAKTEALAYILEGRKGRSEKSNADGLLKDNPNILPTGMHYRLHENNKAFREGFLEKNFHLDVNEYLDAFHSSGYRFCKYDPVSKTWKGVNSVVTRQLAMKRRYLAMKKVEQQKPNDQIACAATAPEKSNEPQDLDELRDIIERKDREIARKDEEIASLKVTLATSGGVGTTDHSHSLTPPVADSDSNCHTAAEEMDGDESVDSDPHTREFYRDLCDRMVHKIQRQKADNKSLRKELARERAIYTACQNASLTS